jgi:hypothetical protein
VRRLRAPLGTMSALAALTLLSAGCHDEPVTLEADRTTTPEPTQPTQPTQATQPTHASTSPGPDTIIEWTRPDGVKVLARDAAQEYVVVDAGRYGVWVSDSLLAEIDVPDGWEFFAGTFLSTSDESGGSVLQFIAAAPRQSTAVPVHPCRDHTYQPVGPTPEELAEALSRQPFLQVTRPVPATVGGMAGFFIKVTIPSHPDLSECEDGQVGFYSSSLSPDDARSAVEPGQARMWILDVNGDRFVVHAETPLDATKRDVDALMAIVDSITFRHDG